MEYGVRGIPKVRQASARTYFEELETRVKDNPHLETWEGEFYFEYHRGHLHLHRPGTSGATGRVSC